MLQMAPSQTPSPSLAVQVGQQWVEICLTKERFLFYKRDSLLGLEKLASFLPLK